MTRVDLENERTMQRRCPLCGEGGLKFGEYGAYNCTYCDEEYCVEEVDQWDADGFEDFIDRAQECE